jgi:hypothetical protein
MSIDNDTLKRLQKSLPTGYAKIIRERLMKRRLFYSPVYIYQCINPNNIRDNEIIVDEAMSLLSEMKAKRDAKSKFLNSLMDDDAEPDQE